MPFDVRGQIAIITGSAQGFGKEFAKRLLRQGAKVCVSDINGDIGSETLQELQRTYGASNVTFKTCNVTQEKDWDELWQHTEYYFGGKVSILINNAGVHAIHGWKACIDIMCYGVGLGANLAIERMATSKGGNGGRIVNIASMAGLFTRLGGTAFPIEAMGYTVAKHGAVALTRAIRDSEPCLYQTEGIKAYAICPFFADTQLVREGSSGKDGIKALEKRLKKRVLTVNEVGHALDVCLEKDMNGECYVVFPDVPIFRMPCGNVPIFYSLMAFGQLLGAPLGIEDFTLKHVGVAIFILLFIFYFLFRMTIF